jgi:hypothetical protein
MVGILTENLPSICAIEVMFGVDGIKGNGLINIMIGFIGRQQILAGIKGEFQKVKV